MVRGPRFRPFGEVLMQYKKDAYISTTPQENVVQHKNRHVVEAAITQLLYMHVT